MSQKTTVNPPVQPTKAAQEAIDMPPPDIPTPLDFTCEHEQASQSSGYVSLEQQEEQSPQVETPASSRRRKMKRWDYYTPSGSETEMAPGSADLQSHDPRPESVAMAHWAQGLGAPTASTADVKQPVLSRPLTLTTHEKVMEAGQKIDSTLPFKYEVNETHKDQEFRTPRQQLPAWKNDDVRLLLSFLLADA